MAPVPKPATKRPIPYNSRRRVTRAEAQANLMAQREESQSAADEAAEPAIARDGQPATSRVHPQCEIDPSLQQQLTPSAEHASQPPVEAAQPVTSAENEVDPTARVLSLVEEEFSQWLHDSSANGPSSGPQEATVPASIAQDSTSDTTLVADALGTTSTTVTLGSSSQVPINAVVPVVQPMAPTSPTVPSNANATSIPRVYKGSQWQNMVQTMADEVEKAAERVAEETGYTVQDCMRAYMQYGTRKPTNPSNWNAEVSLAYDTLGKSVQG